MRQVIKRDTSKYDPDFGHDDQPSSYEEAERRQPPASHLSEFGSCCFFYKGESMRVSVLHSPMEHLLLEAHEGDESDQDVLRQLTRNRYDIGGGCNQGQMLYANLPLKSQDRAIESARYERFGRRMAEMLKDACKVCRTDVDLASAVEIAVGCGVAMDQVYSRELHGEVPDVADGDSIVVWDDNGSVS